MTAVLDDQVRLMESNWFMSYPHDVYARCAARRRSTGRPATRCGRSRSTRTSAGSRSRPSCSRTATTSTSRAAGRRHRRGDRRRHRATAPAELRRVAGWARCRPTTSSWPTARVTASCARSRATRSRRRRSTSSRRRCSGSRSDLFDAIPEDDEVDFVDTVAAPLPDDHDRADARCSDRAPRRLPAVVRLVHRESARTPAATNDETDDRNITDIIEFREYFAEQLHGPAGEPARRPPHEADAGRVGRRSRSTVEAQLSMAQILMIAGNETTRSLSRGAGQAMAEHPDQRAILGAVARARADRGRGVPAVTSRRSRTCAAPRSTTSSSGASRSAAATTCACSTRGEPRRGDLGAAPTSST